MRFQHIFLVVSSAAVAIPAAVSSSSASTPGLQARSAPDPSDAVSSNSSATSDSQASRRVKRSTIDRRDSGFPRGNVPEAANRSPLAKRQFPTQTEEEWLSDMQDGQDDQGNQGNQVSQSAQSGGNSSPPGADEGDGSASKLENDDSGSSFPPQRRWIEIRAVDDAPSELGKRGLPRQGLRED